MSKPANQFYEFGPFRVDAQKRLLLREGEAVPLTPKAFDILLALLARHGEALSKEELMQAVWPDVAVEENNLTRNISTLRKALGEKPDEHRYVVTIPGSGYRFVAAVTHPAAEVAEHEVRASADLEPSLAPNRLKPELRAPEPYAAATRRIFNKRNRAAITGLTVLILTITGAAVWRVGLNRQPRSAGTIAEPFRHLPPARLTNTGNVRGTAISPDGKYVAIALREAGKQSLWLRQMTTAGSVQLVPPDYVIYNGLTFSPRGDYVYYSVFEKNQTDETLYRVPLLGGATPQKLLTRIASSLSFSPDGQRFVYTSSQIARNGLSRVLLANADGTGAQELAVRRAPDFFCSWEEGGPAWSPDGKFITAAAGIKGQNESWLVAINVADGIQRRLTRQPWVEVRQSVWLSDGSGLLVVAQDKASAPFQIWFVAWPTGDAARITNDLLNYRGVSLTAQADALVTTQRERVSSLWIATGKEPRQAVQLDTIAGKRNGDDGLAWTTDGRIVYRSDADGKPALWIVNADGTGARQLTVQGNVSGAASMAPDGRSLLFTSDRSGVAHIWRMGLDGSHPQQLSEGNGETYGQLTADGQWLIYQNTPEAGSQRLWKRPLAGGPAVQLTNEISRQPSISPDGKLIAYLAMDAHGWGLAVIPLADGAPRQRFPLPPSAPAPALRWTPDGQALAYIDDRDEVSNIWLQPLTGGAPRPLTRFKEKRLRIFSFAWSRDGKQLVLARGSDVSDVVLMRATSEQ